MEWFSLTVVEDRPIHKRGLQAISLLLFIEFAPSLLTPTQLKIMFNLLTGISDTTRRVL